MIFDITLLVLWVIVIFTLSSVSGRVLAGIQKKRRMFLMRTLISDPVMHFSEYAILAFLGVRFCSNFTGLLYVFGSGALIALCDEWYQSMNPSRGFELKDWFMDVLGIITVVGFVLLRSAVLDAYSLGRMW